jgi:hypothetical protein
VALEEPEELDVVQLSEEAELKAMTFCLGPLLLMTIELEDARK